KILQDYTRHLLLDAVVKRPLVEEKPYLRSVLFLHWRGRVSEKFITEGDIAESEDVKAAKSFKQLSKEFSQKVLRTLDLFVWDLNEEIRFHWFKSIQHKLHELLKNKEININKQLRIKENEINKVNREISGLEKQISAKEKKKPDETNNEELSLYNQQMSNSYSKIRDKFVRIRDIYLEIANLYIDLINTPRLVEHLSIHEKYGEFSESFFEDRDVAQCIEPLFSKVLGHDRFFPVHVCNKPAENGKTILGHLNGGRNFIDPCDQRCQHHVLGHLYVGDMCSRQTANQLDKNRRVHQLGTVPNRLIHPRIFQ
ncbi:MAG: hypothetical protein JNJ47_02725, partial [Alphaproteobacteria bacterium]|nr:hypothetical protein [Alphaproteobacteria bacterium]